MSRTITVDKDCPFCGHEATMEVSRSDYAQWQNGLNIQEAFPNMNTFDREVLQSGICYTCQESTFGVPSPEHEEEWGRHVGECTCCGEPIYEKHNAVGDKFECARCYVTMILDKDMGYLLEEE